MRVRVREKEQGSIKAFQFILKFVLFLKWLLPPSTHHCCTSLHPCIVLDGLAWPLLLLPHWRATTHRQKNERGWMDCWLRWSTYAIRNPSSWIASIQRASHQTWDFMSLLSVLPLHRTTPAVHTCTRNHLQGVLASRATYSVSQVGQFSVQNCTWLLMERGAHKAGFKWVSMSIHFIVYFLVALVVLSTTARCSWGTLYNSSWTDCMHMLLLSAALKRHSPPDKVYIDDGP